MPAQTKRLKALVALAASICPLLVQAEPVSAATSDTGAAGADGIEAAGLLNLPGTPSVDLPAEGTPAQYGAAITVPFAPLFSTRVLAVGTSSINFATAAETITSTASLDQVGLLPPLGLSIGQIRTTCTSSASGSSGTTTISSLTIAGRSIPLPPTIPPNYVIGGSQLDALSGVVSIVLNAQHGFSILHTTELNLDGAVISLVGAVDDGETIDIADSRCSASGPDIDLPAAVTPEAPASLLIPASGAVVGGVAFVAVSRRRRTRAVAQ